MHSAAPEGSAPGDLPALPVRGGAELQDRAAGIPPGHFLFLVVIVLFIRIRFVIIISVIFLFLFLPCPPRLPPHISPVQLFIVLTVISIILGCEDQTSHMSEKLRERGREGVRQ